MSSKAEKDAEMRQSEQFRQAGRALAYGIESGLNRFDKYLTHLYFKREAGGWKAVIKRIDDNEYKEVAFRDAETLDALVRRIEAGVREDSLKWREDTPWKG